MAEFCKECFKEKILSSEDRNRIKDENIVESEDEDICEGCLQFKKYVLGIRNG